MIVKVVKQTDLLTLTDLVKKVMNDDKIIIYYRSKNNPIGEPVFFNIFFIDGIFYANFSSIFFRNSRTFRMAGSDKEVVVYECLRQCLDSREIYCTTNAQDLFKTPKVKM